MQPIIPNSKSELKLPRLMSTNLSSDSLVPKGKQKREEQNSLVKSNSIHNSILGTSSIMHTSMQNGRHKAYILDSSMIAQETGKDIAEKMHLINIHEQKKLYSPDLETDFDLLGFINSKTDKEKPNSLQHYCKEAHRGINWEQVHFFLLLGDMKLIYIFYFLSSNFQLALLTIYLFSYFKVMQDDLKTQFYIEKKAIYAKVSIQNKNFPLKVKVSGLEGVYDFFFSFYDPFPNKDKSSEEFPQRKDHLYKFNKPKTFSQWAYFCISSKENAKVEMKVWFTDATLEKFRSKESSKVRPNLGHGSVSLKEKLKIEMSEQEKKQLQNEVKDIKQKKLERYQSTDMQIVIKNKEMAAHVDLMQRKKEIDFVVHRLKCEEVVRKSINIQLDTYQQRYQKYISKIITHRMNLEKIAKAKVQKEINEMAKGWSPYVYLIKITEYCQNKIYMKKLTEIFKGRQKRAFEELIRTFKGRKLEMKPYLDDKQRLMNEILMGMNMRAKMVKKAKKRMVLKVLFYFVHNQKQNSVMQNIFKLSKKFLASSKLLLFLYTLNSSLLVVLIQRKRRATVTLHQFITLKMLDGILETLKDEDFKSKQLNPEIKETTEISFYSNYLKKKDKTVLVKQYLKVVKEKFNHQLRLSTGKIQPQSEEDTKFLDLEASNAQKCLSQFLELKPPSEQPPQQQEQPPQQQEQPSQQQEQPQEQAEPAPQQEEIQVKKSKYNLFPKDWKLLEIIRTSQVKLKIIQGRSILRELILKKLNEIKKERDEGANDLYLTQQQAPAK